MVLRVLRSQPPLKRALIRMLSLLKPECLKKSATTGQDFATGSMNYEEIESGLSEANGGSMPVGVRGTVMANGQLTAKDEPVSNTTEVKEVDGSEITKPDMSETSKAWRFRKSKAKSL